MDVVNRFNLKNIYRCRRVEYSDKYFELIISQIYEVLSECFKGKDTIKELETLVELQEFYLMKNDANRITTQDSRFHELIYTFSRSTVIRDTLFPLHNKTQKYRRAMAQNKGRATGSIEEHCAIYEAIAAHNGKLAAEKMTEHVTHAKEHLLSEEGV